ncbi:hypothetical protein [Pseudooceanicola nitratireducens]|jgi:hypothetical protein|uniref:hypothetical protein n=1 Tax=Pseudooceanicola nitratireducens TaxID=517719 RepID=UPI0023F49BBC|nr:hypothetical protein [Pseudooceanicola nitratireducens]
MAYLDVLCAAGQWQAVADYPSGVHNAGGSQCKVMVTSGATPTTNDGSLRLNSTGILTADNLSDWFGDVAGAAKVFVRFDATGVVAVTNG